MRLATATALIASTLCGPLRGQVDAEINKSVWKQKYGVLDTQIADPVWLAQDADGDGVKNSDELAAGTNPFRKLPGDPHFRAPMLAMEPETLSLEFPTVPGKLYQAESGGVTLQDWIAGTLPSVEGDGTRKTLNVPKSAGAFFRVKVSDKSTRNDSMSDWAKLMLGFSVDSPLSAQTSYDPATLATSLSAENVVNLSAVTTTAAQPPDAATAGDAGVIRITRSGTILPGEIVVPISKSGTAIEGVDFAPLPSAIEFPPGVNSIDLKIIPLFNPARKTNTTVLITATGPTGDNASGSYTLGNPAQAGVTIRPGAPANGTGLLATFTPGYSSTYTSLNNFNGWNGGLAASYAFTRGTPTTTGTITVTYSGLPTTPFAVGNTVSLSFTSGNLIPRFAGAADYTITAVTPVTFTVGISATTALPSSGSGTTVIANFGTTATRIDPVIDFYYSYGPPNGNIYVGADNHSVRWEGYLAPATAGNFVFQLDADDKARILIDLNDGQGLTQILENGWDTPATGGFKQSAGINLAVPAAPANRYRMVVEYAETTGNAKCRIQCKRGTGAFANFPATASISNVYTNNTAAVAGWNATYYANSNFTEPNARVQTETSITASNNGDWGAGSPDPSIFHNNFTIRWSGQVLPQYSGKYYFISKTDDGGRLWVNDQLVIDRWSGAGEVTGSIDLKAGVYYDIVMEMWENTSVAEARLWWYSQDQARQIVPTGRLFPAQDLAPRDGGAGLAASVLTSPSTVSAVLPAGVPFSTTLTASNSGTFTTEGMPAWLTLVNGVLTGTPPGPGTYQFTVITTNELGSSSSIMTIEILAGAGNLTRELWKSGVTGPALSDVPWHAAPTESDSISAAEDTTNHGGNTGERLRGYFTAPSTANYYFWVASGNTAELWISNDAEPVNKILRAKVTAPGTAPRVWDAQPGQKSPWLSLIGGRKYYFEVLHNTGGTGAANHLSIGWFQDPTGNTTNPIQNGTGLLPVHLISPWDNPPTTTIPGTLFVTNLQGADGVPGITATGGAFIRAAGSEAVIQLDYSGLSSGVTSRKIHDSSGQLLFDIGAQERNFPALKTSDGGFTWNLSTSDLNALAAGGARIVIGTVNHPDGEITGTFGRVEGSQAAPPPPPYPSWYDDHATNDAANSRFLTQATFGPSPADMAAVKSTGYRAWIEDQFTLGSTRILPDVLANLSSDPQNAYGRDLFFNSWWKNSITAPDQLRQRAAFALSEIFVVSNTGPLDNNGRVLADYYDSLLDSAFGNFNDILKQVTLAPAMGVYLDMRGNSKGDIVNGVHPNENYAREILQLFSAGLYRRWPDGTLVLDSRGLAVPTYDQSTITGFARVFTGWNWGQPMAGGRLPTSFSPSTNYLDPMVLVPARHELGTKILMDNVVLPAATVVTSTDTSTDPTSTYSVQTTDPTLGPGNLVTTTITNRYDLNGVKDLELALGNIMNNPAVAPYVCRQLIQRLVTSHPKPEYVARVVRAFYGQQNVDGVATGVVGDMKEVFRSILLDYEARSSTAAADPRFGKQREPLLRITGPARSLPPPSFPGSTYRQSGLQPILITTQEPHRLGAETVHLNTFADSGGITADLPNSQGYTAANMTPSYSYVFATGIVTVNSPGYLPGDTVALQFTSGSLNKSPFNTVQTYTVTAVTPTSFSIIPTATGLTANTSGNTLTPYNFTVNGAGMMTGLGYTISGTTVTLTLNNHGLTTGQRTFVKFSSGALVGAGFDGKYTVVSSTANNFTITLPSTPAATTAGSALIPRFSGGYNVANDNTGGGSLIDFYTGSNNNLQVGDEVYINILVTNSGTAVPDGIYTVAEIRGRNVFRVVTPVRYGAGNQSSGGMLAYPLEVPSWNRSGTCTVRLGTFGVSSTENDLGQTPLNSPTVFNFFYPDYQYPGLMARAGMTTPEFQLSDASSIMNLTGGSAGNGVSGAILSGTANGYTSYKSSSVVCDLGPYMTPALTGNAGIPDLIDSLGTLLTGGNLTPEAKSIITGYVANTANFSYSSPPTVTQMRDRVRAVVHLITTSAEYAIQR